jgi:hypothetical protein
MDQALRLAESLTAYLCHEMAGTLSTLAATIELGDEPAEALALAGEAAARLRFLRAAWGGGAGALEKAGFAALAAGVPGADRCPVAVDVTGTLAPDIARAALCLLPVAVMALPRGGTIDVSGCLTIRVAGQGAGWPAALAACVSSTETAWGMADEPRRLALPLACLVAGQLGVAMRLVSDTEIVLGG